MPGPVHREEIEIKLPVLDVPAIHARLKQLRARTMVPRTYECNTLYDTPRGDLRRRGQLIRIRIEQPASRPGKKRPSEDLKAILTYKGPAHSKYSGAIAAAQSAIRRRFKIKEEAEVSLVGPDEMERILRALGLRPSFRYEKFRTTYRLPGVRGLEVELDEPPIGIYLELEGSAASIDRGARLLGYAVSDYRKESYGALYLADCRRRGRKPGNMLFPPTKKLRKCPLFP